MREELPAKKLGLFIVTGANWMYGRVTSSRMRPTRPAQAVNLARGPTRKVCGRQTTVANDWEWTHSAYEAKGVWSSPPTLFGILRIPIVRCQEVTPNATRCIKFNCERTLFTGTVLGLSNIARVQTKL